MIYKVKNIENSESSFKTIFTRYIIRTYTEKVVSQKVSDASETINNTTHML